MKRMLSFIPLAIGISSALIYIFNIIQFRMVGSATTMIEAVTKLRIYLYISIAGFVIYFLLKLFFVITSKKSTTVVKEVVVDNSYEPFEGVRVENNSPIIEEPVAEKVIIKEVIGKNIKYCYNCDHVLNEEDRYCSSCGADQERRKKVISPIIKNIISVIEIVILILIIYFLLNMLFDFKEKQDPSFKSPFKVSMTK